LTKFTKLSQQESPISPKMIF